MAKRELRRIVITGATSGIGRELAVQYALEPGAVLGLVGRREHQLEEAARAARDRGAEVHTYPVDVRDRAAMAEVARSFVAAAGGVDLVVANAGVGGPDKLEEGDPTLMNRMFEVNVLGVLNTLAPFVPTMLEQGSGQLVAVASVAGFRALPNHAAYGATKIAVRTLMEGFSYRLERRGILVTTINPGFVVSEMTAKNRFHMPFMLDTAPAAERIRRAIRRGRRVYTFPLPMAILARIMLFAPRFLMARFER